MGRDDVALRRAAASLRDAGLGGPLEAKSVIDFLQSVQHDQARKELLQGGNSFSLGAASQNMQLSIRNF